MDNGKKLSDDNLEKLGLIKDINIYSIVDEEIDKKRERTKLWLPIGALIFVLSFAIMVGIVAMCLRSS